MPASNSKRPAPAFQCYAANRLADRGFKSMSAIERGVLHTIECEAWVNGSVPCDKRALARVLGLELPEVEAGLTERVLRHLEQRNDEFVVPELETYRQELDHRHARMSEGGKQSAAVINKRRQADRHPDEQAERALVQDRTDQSRTVSMKGDIPIDKEFVRALEGPSPFEVEAARNRVKPGIRS